MSPGGRSGRWSPLESRVGLRFHIPSTGALAQFAGAMARILRPGDRLILTGELGAGKTTFTRALAAAMGIDPRWISSPTFTILTVHDGPIRLIHADAYRLSGPEEFEAAGFDAADAASAVTVVEWGERVASALAPPEGVARLNLRITGTTSREVALDLPASWSEREGMAALHRLAC